MRLFVAVELSEAVREAAARVARELAEAFGPGAKRAVSWVAPANMHLTVRFLGETDPRAAEDLVRRMAAPFETPAFRLAIGGLGAFPRSGPPRVIWAGLTEGAESLSHVHDEIEARLEGLDVEREERPFRAHLTLGRVKAPPGAAARQAIASIRGDAISACDIREATLFESRLSPHGAIYTALARGRLG
jgi:2'-5' RNA ligase